MLNENKRTDMTTIVVEEEPLIVLHYSDYNTSGTYAVYASMLAKADVGTEFSVSCHNTCGRGVYDQRLKVVFKDDRGVACVLSRFGTTDDPNPVEEEFPDQLIWFRIRA